MALEMACVYYDNQKCKKFEEPGYTSWCVLGPCAHQTPSNADRIRAMSDEELADFITEAKWECRNYRECKECPRYIGDCCLPLDEWLKQPAEE